MTYTGPEPQYEWDLGIAANDGTRWTYVGEAGQGFPWVGWQPGEDGVWNETDETVRRDHPEVTAYQDRETHP